MAGGGRGGNASAAAAAPAAGSPTTSAPTRTPQLSEGHSQSTSIFGGGGHPEHMNDVRKKVPNHLGRRDASGAATDQNSPRSREDHAHLPVTVSNLKPIFDHLGRSATASEAGKEAEKSSRTCWSGTWSYCGSNSPRSCRKLTGSRRSVSQFV